MSDEPERAHPTSEVEWLDERRLRVTTRLAWLAALPGPVAVMISWLATDWLGPLAAFGVALSVWMLFLAPFVPIVPALLRERIGGDGTASVDPEAGLVVRRGGREVRVAPSRLAVAWAREARRVEVLLHDGELSALVSTEDDAAALVRELRRVVGRSRAYEVSVQTPGLRLLRQSLGAWAPAAAAAIALVAGPWGLVALPPAIGVAVLAVRGVPRLRFGADGVEVLGRLRRRYVPYKSIAGVRISSTLFGRMAVSLALEDGGRVAVAWLAARSRAELVRALVEEGLRMVEDGAAAGARMAALERGSDDAEAWSARVAGVATGADYRAAAVDVERLWSLARNPAADPEQRVGAALALRDQPEGLARIRVAAEVSAEPEVRAALEALAEQELEPTSLRRALRHLDRAERRG